jgi:hypothetical protein
MPTLTSEGVLTQEGGGPMREKERERKIERERERSREH